MTIFMDSDPRLSPVLRYAVRAVSLGHTFEGYFSRKAIPLESIAVPDAAGRRIWLILQANF
jgi:hypothetical protein